jgi:hypothetical protein
VGEEGQQCASVLRRPVLSSSFSLELEALETGLGKVYVN